MISVDGRTICEEEGILFVSKFGESILYDRKVQIQRKKCDEYNLAKRQHVHRDVTKSDLNIRSLAGCLAGCFSPNPQCYLS